MATLPLCVCGGRTWHVVPLSIYVRTWHIWHVVPLSIYVSTGHTWHGEDAELVEGEEAVAWDVHPRVPLTIEDSHDRIQRHAQLQLQHDQRLQLAQTHLGEGEGEEEG